MVLAFGRALGSFLGAKGAERLPLAYIKTLVAFLLLASGVYMVIILLFG